MKTVVLKKTDPLFLKEVDIAQVPMGAGDYLFRLRMLRERMGADGIDAAVIVGDREHFANIEYFCGYDCRFEEGMLVVPREGIPTLLVGNEGMSYSFCVPYDIRRAYYRNFSLQGQLRSKEERLDIILREAGVIPGATVGLVGFKYFLPEYIPTDPKHTFDAPHYVVEALRGMVGFEKVVNYTAALTGLDGGIRLRVYTAKEIAAAEAAAARSGNVLIRLLKNLKPGMTEYALSESARVGFAPHAMHPLVNFGPESVALGIRSPRDDRKLSVGDACGLCYGVRGSLSSRVGVASYDENTMHESLRPHLFSFYGAFFRAMGAWYEALKVGADGDTLHHAVHGLLDGPNHHVELNCGHFTGMDEWVNALSYDGSIYTVPDGAYMQADIISSMSNPARTAICEDPAIVAGPELRAALEREYPEVYGRIRARQRAFREALGIALHDDVLPLSNINAAMFPFMLNPDVAFALEEA
ncbi:MAG: hypothetical protein GX592_04605 [Clostridiales bacterium]|nr:hypothetical protein [Clostridiales bacterium]